MYNEIILDNKAWVKVMKTELASMVDCDTWNFNDELTIGKNTISDYLHGRCHLFAIAIKKVFQDRCKLIALCETQTTHSSSYLLTHMYAIIDEDIMIDARGVIGDHTIDDYMCIAAESNIDYIDSYKVELDLESVISQSINTYWGEFMSGEEKILLDFITKNKAMYELGIHIEGKYSNEEIQAKNQEINHYLHHNFNTEILL